MSKYKIGDKVWYAQRKSITKTVICPDCFGQRALTVIKGDDSRVSIGCAGCRIGFKDPTGYINYWSQEIDVSEVTIETIEETALKTEYGFRNCYRTEETELFTNKEDAEKRALVLAEEHNQKELDNINQKEKHNHTWSWNACYHRNCIKNAERDLIYHKAKLEVAKVKAKDKART